jgi:Mn2+/Fe2+ NRAMP family transporter
VVTPRRQRTGATAPVWRRGGLWRYLAILGPGLIAANAGNDAGGVFTYSNTGAKYGLSLLWTVIPTLIALIVVQEMVARLGVVTGKGLMDLIREQFGVRWTVFAVITVLIANGGTTLAEFAGVAGGFGLLGVPRWIAIPVSAVLLAVIVLRGSRPIVERIFLAMGLAFLSYLVTAVLVHPDWQEVVRTGFFQAGAHPGVPRSAYTADVIALIGTSITPYMQLYLQSSVVEKGTPPDEYPYVRLDVVSGAVFAQLVAVFIVITTGATLFGHGFAGKGVGSADDAAQALVPLAGIYAAQLFAVGLIGASLLAAAVVPLSTAFVVAEGFGAERSIQNRFPDAPLFFGLFLGLLAVTALIMLIPGVPIAGVAIGTQTLDGILLPVLLVFILILANNRRLLGSRVNGRIYNLIAVITVGILSLLTVALIATSIPGSPLAG